MPKVVKLSDEEILSLYHQAQKEAQIEADWRAIEGPTEAGSLSSRSSVPGSGEYRSGGGDVDQYLMALSRILQHKDDVRRENELTVISDAQVDVCCRPGNLGQGSFLGAASAGRGGPQSASPSWLRGQALPQPPDYPLVI